MSVSQILDSTGVIQAIYLPGGAASNYVPYVGADSNVNLGTNTLTAQDVVANSTTAVTAGITGTATVHTLNVTSSIGSCPDATIVDASIVTLTSTDITTTALTSTTAASLNNVTVSGTLTSTDVAALDRVVGQPQALGSTEIIYVNNSNNGNIQNILLNVLPVTFAIQVTGAVSASNSNTFDITFPVGYSGFQNKDLILVGSNITDSTGNSLFTVPPPIVNAGFQVPYSSIFGVTLQKSGGAPDIWQLFCAQNEVLYTNANIGDITGSSPTLTFNLTVAIV